MATLTEPLVVRPNRATYRAHRAAGPGALNVAQRHPLATGLVASW